MPSIVDVAGINRISRAIYANAAGAIVGMVKIDAPTASEDKPLDCRLDVRQHHACCRSGARRAGSARLRGAGLPRHGHGRQDNGKPDRGWLYHRFAGHHHHRAGRRGVRRRLERRSGTVLAASAQPGIPAVLVPGCVDMANFWGMDTVPEKYRPASSTNGTPISPCCAPMSKKTYASER